MGDVTHHLMNSAIRGPAVDEKADALALQHRNMELWSSGIKPHLTDDVLADKIDASVQYGVYLLCTILALTIDQIGLKFRTLLTADHD